MSKTAKKRFQKTWIKLGIFAGAYTAVCLSGYILHLYLSTFSWMQTNPLYPYLHFINMYKKEFVLLGAMIGIGFILIWDYYKMYRLVEQEVREASKRADESEQRKNDLVVYLAHDLKTPLTSVMGYLELLRDEPDISVETRQRYLGVVYQKSERLEDLINEFFEITRYNLTHILLEKSTINLSRMLEQILFEFQPMLLEKNLECELQMAKDTMYYCDADRMQRVFDNLLRNAVNYSFLDSVIQISMKEEDDSLCIIFQNAGHTIPPEKLNRIFEQFFRLDESRGSKSGGSGVGLAIAKEIIELHEGEIKAYSEKEEIRFTINLPR